MELSGSYTDLRRGALEFLETILEADGLRLELVELVLQQVLVELDLFEEALGCGVVVPSLVGEVDLAHVVHRLVYVRHEQRHRLAHVRLCVNTITQLTLTSS